MSTNVMGGEDSRNPLERLRRHDLYKIANANNINYPPGAPAEDVRKLIEATGIDVLNPANGVEWVEVVKEDEKKNKYTELYPAEKPHYSERNDIDYDNVIEKAGALTMEIAELTKEMNNVMRNPALDEVRKADKVGRLKGQIKEAQKKKEALYGKAEPLEEVHVDDGPTKEELMAQIEALQAQLGHQNQSVSENEKQAVEELKMPELRKYAKSLGLTVQPTMKKADIIELINGQNTS